jgi:Spy/CpxP family protein refolding chaperone
MSRALQWKLTAGFLLVFIAGGMTGAFFGVAHTRREFFESPRRGVMGERMRERLRTQLDLTPEQLAKISPIIDKTASQLDDIRRDTGRRVRDLIKDAHEQMAANLTDAQRVKLQKIEEGHRHWRHRGFHRRTPPSPSEQLPDDQ